MENEAKVSLWVKKEGEGDDKAEEVRIPPGTTASALKTILYTYSVFAFAPGTIDGIVVGDKVCLLLLVQFIYIQVLDNRTVLDTSLIYEVRLKSAPGAQGIHSQSRSHSHSIAHRTIQDIFWYSTVTAVSPVFTLVRSFIRPATKSSIHY